MKFELWQHPFSMIFLQLCALFFTMLAGSAKRKRFWIAFPLGFIAGFASAWFIPMLKLFNWLEPGFPIALLLASALSFFCYRLSVKQILFYSIAVYALQNLIHHLSSIIWMYLAIDSELQFTLDYLINMCLSLILASLIYFDDRRRKKNQGGEAMIPNYRLIIIAFITMLIANILSSLLVISHIEKSVLLITRLLFALCEALCLVLLFGFQKESYLEREKETIEQLLSEKESQAKLAQENIELINLKCHDIKHQIASLKEIRGEQNFEAMVSGVEKSVSIYDANVVTGNTSLDIVLTEKSLICERRGIRLASIVDGKSLDFIEQSDIYSLFGNALDNAIEALSTLKEEDKRFINLNVFSKGKLLTIHMENYLENENAFADGLPLTTKEDKRFHGYGMKSIRYIVEKYQGSLNVSEDNHLFRLNILVPIP
jgi:hypothetical protein